MKKTFFAFVITLVTIPAFSQTITLKEGGLILVNSDSTTIQLEASGSGVISAILNDSKTEILTVFNNGDVLVKKLDGTTLVQLAEATTDKGITAVWGENNTVVITRLSGEIQISNALEWRQ
jgi:hypothetical protein